MSWVSLLGVAFIVLKLIGVISWSWVLVTMPIWLIFALRAIWLGVMYYGLHGTNKK